MCTWLKTEMLKPLDCVYFAVITDFLVAVLRFWDALFWSGWTYCSVGISGSGGWYVYHIYIYFFFCLISLKFDFFVAAQHLLGWWCCPSDWWYGNSEAIPAWSWGMDRWNGTCEYAALPGQSSNCLSFSQQLVMVTLPCSIPDLSGTETLLLAIGNIILSKSPKRSG